METLSIPGDYQYRALTYGIIPQRFWHANKLDLLNIIGDFSENDIVLDAGCGSGNLSIALAQKVYRVVGFDNNSQAITFAQNRAKKMDLNNFTFLRGDLKSIPFEDEYFSKVVLFEVVEHLTLATYQKILLELYRVMKPGGRLYLTTPNRMSLWPIIEWVLDILRLVPPLKEQHILEFTPTEANGIISQNGFRIITFGTMNHVSPFISLFSWGLARKIFRFEINHLKKLGPIIWLVAEKP